MGKSKNNVSELQIRNNSESYFTYVNDLGDKVNVTLSLSDDGGKIICNENNSDKFTKREFTLTNGNDYMREIIEIWREYKYV